MKPHESKLMSLVANWTAEQTIGVLEPNFIRERLTLTEKLYFSQLLVSALNGAAWLPAQWAENMAKYFKLTVKEVYDLSHTPTGEP